MIGIAKTGSGKTLAFMLPMLRHVVDQPELKSGEGPIGGLGVFFGGVMVGFGGLGDIW